MIIENPIPPYLEWIGTAALNWLISVGALILLFSLIALVFLTIRKGPKQAIPAFVGGIRGLQTLADRVDSGAMAVAFSMYPTTMEDLMDIADAGAIMPPKSTWFEPKLRSGLFIHKLSE